MLPFAANWHMGDIRVRAQPISCVKNALVRLLSPHSGQRHFGAMVSKLEWTRQLGGNAELWAVNNLASAIQ